MAAFLAALAAPEVIAAIIGLIGLILKNKWLALLGTVAFLYFVGKVFSLPPFIWIIVLVVMFLWIFNQGKGK